MALDSMNLRIGKSAAILVALALVIPVKSSASGESRILVYESWSRSPNEIVYARAGEKSGKLEDLCVQTEHLSFHIPLKVFP